MTKPADSSASITLVDYRVGNPSAALAGNVASYSSYHETIGQSVCRLEAPKDRVVLILGLGRQLGITPVGSRIASKKYGAFVVGLGGKPLLTKHDGAQYGIEVALFPWAVEKLFDIAADDLAQAVVSLEDLWGREACLLIDQLRQISSWEKRFALVDQVLEEKIVRSNKIVLDEVQWAWCQLEQHKGCLSIRELAEEIGWSDRYFIARFREQIGVTPKIAARQIRFSYARCLLESSEEYSISNIAAVCGYSDQSHLTREFRAFAYCSPMAYRQAQFSTLPGISSSVIEP